MTLLNDLAKNVSRAFKKRVPVVYIQVLFSVGVRGVAFIGLNELHKNGHGLT